MSSYDFEIVVIGAGVVGLAVAARLSGKTKNILVIERNNKYGMETSSRNSEVIHAGIYYAPGSLKAALCVEGRDELYSLCRQYSISYNKITKIIVARNDDETSALAHIIENGNRNGAQIRMIDAHEIKSLEPNVEAVAGIFSPLTGIISAHELMDYFFHTAVNNGALLQHRCEVTGIEKIGNGYKIIVNDSGSPSEFTTEKVINAAGLGADTIAGLAGIDVDKAGYRLHYCKGSYFSVASYRAKELTRLIYPVPNKETLGVHALFDLGGRLRFGPDSEYLSDRTMDYTVADSKRENFLASIRKILPSVTDADIVPDMSGIRPKLQNKGEAERDFVIVHEKERGLEGFVNLIGIESPGLTASPAIARYVEKLIS